MRKLTKDKVIVIKACIVALFVMILVCATYVAIMLDKMNKVKAEADAKAYKKNLESLYEMETTAFGMDMCNHYCDYSYVNETILTIRLASYRERKPEALEVSFEDIKDYLSSEYYEDGQLRVLNRPQNIEDYVIWNYYVGDYVTRNNISALRKYSANYTDKYKEIDIFDMDLGMLNELIIDYENCPNKEDYED